MLIDDDDDVKLFSDMEKNINSNNISNPAKKTKIANNEVNLDELLTTVDFLVKMFEVDPEEFQKQLKNRRAKIVKSLVPDVGEEKIIQNTFNSFREYYEKMEQLLLMETWEKIFDESDRNDTRREFQ